jgi:hypothetical protein
MKNIALKNRIISFSAGIGAVAVLMLGLPVSQPQTGARQQTTVSAHQALQVADGSESNGGKGGGKGGAKLTGIA